jgi:CelD/BcsL family acetyltransferase involved in cellulose biosynthesis
LNAALKAEPIAARGALERLLVINPLECPNWDSLVATRRESSFFHGSAWARVLHESYGHSPCYFCEISDNTLQTLLPVVEVSSAVTGRRGVSLPFSDFCAPLTEDRGSVGPLYEAAMEYGRERKWRHLECRNVSQTWSANCVASVAFHGHVIELNDGEEALFKRLDGAVRRGIRKAEHEGLRVEFSDSRKAVGEFFALHCLTRRRHGLPPQPLRFFENIARYVLAAGQGFVATAHLGQTPLASFVFFHCGSEAIYKFGASDFAFQHLRPNDLVMWEAIKHCAANGFSRLHLGRTSLANEGLRRFKLGFGAHEEKIEYRRYDFRRRAFVTSKDRAKSVFNRVFRCLPLGILRLAGEVIYPHLS